MANRAALRTRDQGGSASLRHELTLAVGAGLGVAVAGAIVARLGADEHWPIDHEIRRLLSARGHRRTRAALRVAGTAGTIGVYGPATLLAALLVARKRSPARALPMAASVAASAIVASAVKHIVKRPRPVGITGVINKRPSFPSGHATRATTAAFAIAYLLVRERMMSRHVAMPLATAVATAVGVSRAYADAHWTTDILGGWALGAATGAAGALWYERVR